MSKYSKAVRQYTFRFPNDLLATFRSACLKSGFSINQIAVDSIMNTLGIADDDSRRRIDFVRVTYRKMKKTKSE